MTKCTGAEIGLRWREQICCTYEWSTIYIYSLEENDGTRELLPGPVHYGQEQNVMPRYMMHWLMEDCVLDQTSILYILDNISKRNYSGR